MLKIKKEVLSPPPIERLEDKTIFLKKHYQEDNSLSKDDVKSLVDIVNKYKEISSNIYVCGTSIFRNLTEKELDNFLKYFKDNTGYDFQVISADKENELTVKGATRMLNNKVCVFIGGGGSTEISIVDKDIIESANTDLGVMDILKKFSDLKNDIASTPLEKVKSYIKDRLNLPTNKCDILILAGGGHKRFALNSGIIYEDNTLYNDSNAPIMMDIETREKETLKFFENISLDNIRNNDSDPSWWDATRAMCAFVLVVAEAIDAKYIVPTDISMAYGIVEEQKN